MSSKKRKINILEDEKGFYYNQPSGKKRRLCLHKKQKAICRDCGGSAFCKHGKQKSQCRECGGSAFCKHGKQKAICRECGGSAFCKHGKWKAICRDCGGSAFCKHGKQKATCRECGGSGICSHNIQRRTCKICDPAGHLKQAVSNRVRGALKSDKCYSSIEYLGCDIEFYRVWIEMQFQPGMTWDNFGQGDGHWNIDHKIPIKYTGDGKVTLDMVKERLHYSNTWPMWATENISKGNRFKH